MEGLSAAHDFIMQKMAFLNVTISLLQKTHGFFKCKFNAYLKIKIAQIKQQIKRLKLRCRAVLKQLVNLDHRSQLPFVC